MNFVRPNFRVSITEIDKNKKLINENLPVIKYRDKAM